MAASQHPIYQVKIECPICKTLNEFDTIKQGAYTESGRDTDFCPVGITWAAPAYQKHNPLLYFTASCRNCFYTREFNSVYKEWQNDVNFKSYKLPALKIKHMEEYSNSTGAVRLLGENLDIEKHPNESAIIKLLLAIHDELLNERPSSLDIARFYLRISWIHRFIGQTDTKCERAPVQMIMAKIQNEIEKLKVSFSDFSRKLSPLQKMVLSDFDPVVNSNNGAELSKNLKFALEKVITIAGKLGSDVNIINAEFGEVRKQVMVTQKDEIEISGFREYAGFPEFLSAVKESWSETPASEYEALTRSRDYYLKAYQNSREIKQGLQQLHASYLIAELSRRIEDIESAMDYFKITLKMAHEIIVKEKNDKALVSNARKILEMALEQSRLAKSKVEAVA